MSAPRDLDPDAARARGLLARSELGPEARAVASKRIAVLLTELPELASPNAIAGYWPTAGEVDLTGLWHELADAGIGVVLPRIDPDGSPSMEFVRWEPDAAMTVNRFGIPEPVGAATPRDAIDVVVLPCSAIDDRGTRVGMGAGFYDRAFEDVAPGYPGPLLIAVAFESQRMAPGERIIRRRWDVPVDVVVTEQVVLRPGGRTPSA